METINSLRARDESLRQTNQELRVQLAESQRRANSLIRAHEQKHHCESLYTQGRLYNAAESLLEMENTISEDVRANELIVEWLAGEFGIAQWNRVFTYRHQTLRTDVS